MTINGRDFFMGAYAERVSFRIPHADSNLQISEDHQREIASQLTSALKELKPFRNTKDSVSISEEGRAFLCSDAVNESREEIEALIGKMYTNHAQLQEELRQTDPDDPFWGNAGNQWLVFSEHLYNHGFYEGMSDKEVASIETLLDRITSGMDGVNSARYHTGLNIYPDNNSGEANLSGFDLFNDTSEMLAMDLESSTAALKYFSETYIDNADLRDEFNKLVHQYHSHNEKTLDGYQSLGEKMQKFTNAVYSGKYPGSALLNNMSQSAVNSYSERLEANKYLGGVSHTVEEETQYKKDCAALFEQLTKGASNWDTIWKLLEDTLTDYASKGSDDKRIQQAVSGQAVSTFGRMKGYWSFLLNGNRDNG